MPILMKLLATSMVAKSFFGLSKRLEIIEKAFGELSSPFFTSVRVKENKATSAPDIKAEHISKIINKIVPENTEVFSKNNPIKKLGGSESNIKNLVKQKS